MSGAKRSEGLGKCASCDGYRKNKVHDDQCPFKRFEERDLQLGLWFQCLACGGYVGFFPVGKGHPRHPIPPGSVAHSKPEGKIGIPDSTGCEMYRSLSPREIWAIHMNEQPLQEQPSEFRPLEG